MDGLFRPTGPAIQRNALDEDSRFIVKRPLAFGSTVKAVAPFQERFAFFTMAIPYLWGEFEDLILADFQASVERPVDFFHTKFHRPLFRGLETPDGDPDWNYVLWAIEREFWEPLINHMCGAIGTDTPHRYLYRYAYQELEILDPIGGGGLVLPGTPVLRIGSFGVRSNRYVAALRQETVLQLPQLVFYEADPECTLYARALFEEEDPLKALSLTDKESVANEDSPATAAGGGD